MKDKDFLEQIALIAVLKINEIKLNKGQIEGVPKNPRFIRDERFEALKRSIKEFPEMLKMREVVVYDNDGEFVVVGGNMRLRACKELGYSEIPCKIFPKETPKEKLMEFTVKDNRSFGNDDDELLANEWEMEKLIDWGFEKVEFGMGVEEIGQTDKSQGVTEKYQLTLDFESEIEKKAAAVKLRDEGFKII